MKFSIFAILLILLFSGCTTTTPTPANTPENTLNFEKNDEDEYDIIVFDSQYDVFLMTVAKPKNFYSETYYKNKNQIYVSEWNYRNSQPFRYDPNLYAVYIDYQPNIQYGLTLEYKLYNFFKFIEWKYKVNLSFGR
ncbi:DUF6146 family protein [Moheibacter sp.]|uniref:DUF6146 family protein n=1 Tax=Moheibacter sp. TaxID=1965316 RepID=UPI003C7296B3